VVSFLSPLASGKNFPPGGYFNEGFIKESIGIILIVKVLEITGYFKI